MALDTRDDRDTELNPGQSITDEKFNDLARRTEIDDLEVAYNAPSADDTARSLHNSEVNPSKPLRVSDGDASVATRNDEDANFYRPESNYGGAKSKWGRGLSKSNANAILKRGGPIGLIIALLGVGGFGISGLLALMPIHVLENLENKFNIQNTSLTMRTDKLLASKMSGNATSGSCNIVKIACRFSRPSNTFLKTLAKHGITAEDADGNPISGSDGKWVNKIPKNYIYMKDGVETKVPADKFYSTLVSEADFRAGFHAAYNPLYDGFNDLKANIVKRLNGFNYRDTLKNAKDADDAQKKVSASSAGEDVGAAAAGEDPAKASSVVSKEVEGLANKEVGTLEKVGLKGGNGVGVIAGGVCLLTDTPQVIASAVSLYQKRQFIDYAAELLLTPASAMKAGEDGPSEVSALGDYLSKPDKNGKSALDSFGLRFAMGEATIPAKGDPYIKFSPGANVYSKISGLLTVTDSSVRKNACSAATNPATGLAVDAVLAANAGETFGATLVAAGINAAAGVAASVLLSNVIMPLVSPIIGTIGQHVLSAFMGDLTANLTGEDAGNAIASGAANMMAETANAGGNVPLTPTEAVAYNNETQSVNLAYAKEAQATLSPLDATSQYTALGSFVNNIIPYVSDFSSLTGIFSTVKNIAFSPMNLLSNVTKSSALSSSEYTQCGDPNLQGVAAGPFCNVLYGIPPQYLDVDPETVVNYMVANHDIDENTGEPAPSSDYADWMDLCLEGGSDGSVDNSDTTQTKNCMIDTNTTDATTKTANDKNAMFAIYTIDHRIQVQMDDDYEGPQPGSTSTGTSSTAGSTIDTSKLYTDSTSVACAAGTTDAGVDTGYRNGQSIQIRLCSIPNTYDEDHSGQPAKVNSVVSGAFLSMIQALSKSIGVTTLRVADSYRSMADQQAAFAKYGSPRAAKPGYSNHQMGLAIDFQLDSNNGVSRPGNPTWEWLTANAATYGFTQLPSEAWHWQPMGADGTTGRTVIGRSAPK